MLLLGVMGILQAVFLPGFLVVHFLKLNDGVIKTWVLSFSLSLIINHFVVTIFTAAKIFNFNMITILFVLEAILLLTLSWSAFKEPAMSIFRRDFERVQLVLDDAKNDAVPELLFKIVSFSLAVFTFAYLLKVILGSFVPVFNVWDDIVSWNRWAVSWYKGRIPGHTMNYPQLLPTNWAMIYTFTGNENLQGFAKIIMPLFPLSILLAMVDLALRTRRFGYMMAVSTTGFYLLYLMGYVTLTSGYADLPVAFMAFVPVYLLLLFQYEDSIATIKRNLIVGTICCAGAGLTKQAGVFMVAIYPLLTYLLVLRNRDVLDKKACVRLIMGMYCTLLVMVTPWYIFTQLRILRGGDVSEIFLVKSTIHGGRNLIGRLLTAFTRLRDGFGNFPQLQSVLAKHVVNKNLLSSLGMVLVFSPVVMGSFSRIWKLLLFLVVIPYFLIWALCFSYDLRNFSLAIPFIGAASGIGLQHSKETMQFLRNWIGGLRAGTVLLLAVGMLIFIDSRFDEAGIIAKHLTLRRQIGLVAVNDMLYRYQQQYGLVGKILTNYHLMLYLPGLENHYQGFGFADVKQLDKKLELPAVKFVLILKNLNEKLPDDVNDYLKKKIVAKQLEILPSPDWALFLKVRGDGHP
jgi:hypothetical protein